MEIVTSFLQIVNQLKLRLLKDIKEENSVVLYQIERHKKVRHLST
jgi:hypothetical protein